MFLVMCAIVNLITEAHRTLLVDDMGETKKRCMGWPYTAYCGLGFASITVLADSKKTTSYVKGLALWSVLNTNDIKN